MLKWFKGKKEEKKKPAEENQFSSDAFDVRLVTPTGRLLPGELDEMRMDGITATFESERFPEFEEGAEVKLDFTKLETEREFIIRGVLKELTRVAGEVVCEFQFPDPKLYISELNSDDFSAANRREAFRMEPMGTDEVIVELRWEDKSGQGWMNDISVTGMGLGVTKETAAQMGKPETLKLSMQLPGSENVLQVIGKVLYHKPGKEDNTIHCGVLFDQNKAGGFLAEDKMISTFLNAQQKEMLRRRAKLE